jgi:hypothetical protein
MNDLLAAVQLLIELVEDYRNDPENVDPAWTEQVLASAQLALKQSEDSIR